MDMIPTVTPSYPMLALVVRHGNWASTTVAVALALAALAWSYLAGSVILAIGGVLVALGVFVVVRTLVELVRLVADMLLPK